MSRSLSVTSLATVRGLTKARIGLPSTGVSLKTEQVLEMQAHHARAKDAIYYPLDCTRLLSQLEDAPETRETQSRLMHVESEAVSRVEYLQRPDKGRRLAQKSVELVRAAALPTKRIDIILADGLSPLGIELYSLDLVRDLLARLDGLPLGTIFVCSQGRVAIGDHVGEICQSLMSLVVIGERPGLSSFDSIGCYLTYEPRLGRTDADRNCVSNISASGLLVRAAADKIASLTRGALAVKLTGVGLKEGDPSLVAQKSAA